MGVRILEVNGWGEGLLGFHRILDCGWDVACVWWVMRFDTLSFCGHLSAIVGWRSQLLNK